MKPASACRSGTIACLAAFGWASAAHAALVITEIMYDPAGSNEHEYVEIYNSGNEPVDLTGYKLLDVSNNASILAGGSVPAGGTAVIIRIDASRTLANYQSAWGAGVNFVETPTGTWPNYTNGADTVTLQDANGNVLSTVSYSAANGFPAANDSASIYLKNVALDPTVGANWALSVVGVDGAVQGLAPRASDVGSPGTVVVPEPAGAGAAALLGALSFRRRRYARG